MKIGKMTREKEYKNLQHRANCNQYKSATRLSEIRDSHNNYQLYNFSTQNRENLPEEAKY